MSTRQAYTGYTEIDASARVAVADNILTISDLDTDISAYVYKDFGAGYFSGDFEHTLKFRCTGYVAVEEIYPWAASNSVGDIGALITANTDLHALRWRNGTLALLEQNGAVQTSDSVSLSVDTDYYMRIVRDESVGANGTLYCYIYTDEYYTDLVDTLVVTLTESKDWQYLFAMSARQDGAGGTSFSGTIENLTLDAYPYTLENIVLRTRDLLNEATALFYTDAQIQRWANDAVRELAAIGQCIQHIDSMNTTNGQRSVSVSGHKVEYIEYVADGKGLLKIKPKQIGKFPFNGTSPQYWFEMGNTTVNMDPIPDATYALNGYVVDYPAVEMSANTDIPEIPPEFRPLTILYCVAMGLEKSKRYGAAAQVWGMYKNDLVHLIQDKIAFVPDSRGDSNVTAG